MQSDSLPPPPLEPPPIPQGRLLFSPTDIPADADGSLPWWRPTWGDVARRLGLRWLYIVPVAAVLIGVVVLCLLRFWFFNLVLTTWKLWVLLLVGGVAAIAEAIRQVTRARSEHFCLHCGYTLEGLPDQHICPECGRPFSFELIRLYQNDPKWFKQRWAMRGTNPISAPFDAGRAMGRASKDGT
jgi:hypothetical protein